MTTRAKPISRIHRRVYDAVVAATDDGRVPFVGVLQVDGVPTAHMTRNLKALADRGILVMRTAGRGRLIQMRRRIVEDKPSWIEIEDLVAEAEDALDSIEEEDAKERRKVHRSVDALSRALRRAMAPPASRNPAIAGAAAARSPDPRPEERQSPCP